VEVQTDIPDTSKSARPVRPSLLPWVVAVVMLALIGASFVVPVPSVLLFVPGPVRDVEQLIEVDGADTFSSEGSLYLTTVGVDDQVTVAEWLWSYIDSKTVAIDQESFTQGLSLEELNRLQRQQMTSSKRAASSVALTALDVAEKPGVEIKGVIAEPARGELSSGDVIRTIDGQAIGTDCDLLATVAQHSPGDTVEIDVQRGRANRTLDIRLGSAPNAPTRPFIGIEMSPDDFNPVDFEFKTGNIAGPSAGLMFALALYDRLTPEDLTAGNRIAGTGEIACDGTVGPIGGIQQKVAGAEARGADIFLAPEGNAEAARDAAEDIEVVAVGSFEDAVQHLESLD
jgi:PDZ domain-containing protein